MSVKAVSKSPQEEEWQKNAIRAKSQLAQNNVHHIHSTNLSVQGVKNAAQNALSLTSNITRPTSRSDLNTKDHLRFKDGSKLKACLDEKLADEGSPFLREKITQSLANRFKDSATSVDKVISETKLITHILNEVKGPWYLLPRIVPLNVDKVTTAVKECGTPISLNVTNATPLSNPQLSEGEISKTIYPMDFLL